jgi:tetratricopeptide (TPR) repeat protein
MQKNKTKIVVLLLLGVVVALVSGCGASEANEKVKRQSYRFYEAASIAWFEENDTLAAIRSLTRAITANPDNDDAQYLLGIIRFSRGEHTDAEKHLRKTVALRMENDVAGLAGAQNNLGLLMIHLRRFPEAIELLEASGGEVMNREPWLAMGNLGWAYIEIGEYDKAIEKLRRAMFDQPKYCVGMFRLGQAYYMKKEYKLAEKSLKQSLEIPEDGCDQMQEAFHFIGMTYLRQDNDAEAKDAFTRCIELNDANEIGEACAEALAGF